MWLVDKKWREYARVLFRLTGLSSWPSSILCGFTIPPSPSLYVYKGSCEVPTAQACDNQEDDNK